MLSHHQAASPPGTGTGRSLEPHRKRLKQRPRRSSPSSKPSALAGLRLLPLLTVLVAWTLLVGAATAAGTHGDRRRRSAPLPAVLVEEPAPTWEGSLLVIDTSLPPPVPPLMPPLDDGDPTRTLSAPPSKRSVQTDPKATNATFEIPKPFDSSLSNNFTNTCAAFFKKMLTGDTINNCHPFSLMLQVRSAAIARPDSD